MKGADEYCRLFNKAKQHGRLYLLPHYHARGKTFRIYVLPKGEAVIPNGGFNPPLNKDAVEVYGIVSGKRGWTEKYGWLHEGPWKEDFHKIVEDRKSEIIASLEEKERITSENESATKKRISDFLAAY